MRGLAFLLLLTAAAPAAAQLFDDREARRRIEVLRQQMEESQKAVNARLDKAEGAGADRNALLDLAAQIDALRGEIARMRGQVEVLANQAETGERRQKDLYLDIDTRLRKLEQSRESGGGHDKPAALSPGEAQAEARAYQAALDQFKLGNYALAVSAMQGFLVTYPNS